MGLFSQLFEEPIVGSMHYPRHGSDIPCVTSTLFWTRSSTSIVTASLHGTRIETDGG